jgi:hypothetical protein
MSLASHSQARRLVRQHFALETTPETEHELREHLADCAECSAFYQRHLLLASLDPDAPSAQDRLASGLGFAVPSKPQRSGWWVGAAGMVAAAAAALLLMRAPGMPPSELVARGAGTAVSQVLVYRVESGKSAAPVGSSIAKNDELAFAYVNGGGYRRLLIYGVDEHRHVYWYHPAWTSAADTPHAIAIEPGTTLRELPEAIAHDLDGHQLTIHAVFTNQDVSARDVERLVQKAAAGDAAQAKSVSAALPGAVETQVNLSINPGVQ